MVRRAAIARRVEHSQCTHMGRTAGIELVQLRSQRGPAVEPSPLQDPGQHEPDPGTSGERQVPHGTQRDAGARALGGVQSLLSGVEGGWHDLWRQGVCSRVSRYE